MINLSVDEAYAFDYLSILEVKFLFLLDNQHLQCYRYLVEQLGQDLVISIIQSEEYEKLIEANKKVFLAIEEIRTTKEPVDARVIDNLNTERFLLKKQLQSKFFNSNVSEVKTI